MPKLRIALIVATYFYKFEPCTANITSASAVFVVHFSRSAHSHIKSHLKNLLSNINVYVFRFESRCFGIFFLQICITQSSKSPPKRPQAIFCPALLPKNKDLAVKNISTQEVLAGGPFSCLHLPAAGLRSLPPVGSWKQG